MFSIGFVPLTNNSISPIIVEYRFIANHAMFMQNKTIKLIAAKT